MSELKAYKMVDEKYCTDCVCVIPSDVYIKSEADKMIAELKDKANYNECEYKLKSEELADTCRFYEDELRHHKYKRCLAMVKYCDMGLTYYNEKLYSFSCERADFFYKWYNRWWKIVEKFKEAK